jgi:hypothetical protein
VQALTHALEHVDTNVYELGQNPGRWTRVAVLREAVDAHELGSRYEHLGCEVEVQKELRSGSRTGDDDSDWVVRARK